MEILDIEEVKRTKTHRKNNRPGAGSLFAACILIGLGIGLIIGEARQGVIFGAGCGFILMGIYIIFSRAMKIE